MNNKRLFLPIYKNLLQVFSGHGLKKYSVIRNLNQKITSEMKTNFALVQGNKMFLDPKDNLALSIHGVYEPLETELMKKIIKNGDIVIDIGAFIGYYTLLFAKLVGESGHVYAFEPQKYAYDLIQKNLEVNNLSNVKVENKMISNFDGQDNTSKKIIDVIKLDNYLGTQKIDFIKIDIEGSEMQALDGMTSIIEYNDDIKMMTEFHPTELKKFGTNPKDYLKKLRNMGFEIYHIDNKTNSIKSVSDEYLLNKFPLEDSSTNIFCKKSKS